GIQRAGRALPPRRRHRLRSDRLDDGALLRVLRPEPSDCRRSLVSVSLCAERNRPPRPAARGSPEGRARPLDRVLLADARRPGRGAAARAGEPHAAIACRESPPRPAFGDAHAGRLAVSSPLSAFSQTRTDAEGTSERA